MRSAASELKKEKRAILGKLRAKWAEFDLFKLHIGALILIGLGLSIIASKIVEHVFILFLRRFNGIKVLITLVHF